MATRPLRGRGQELARLTDLLTAAKEGRPQLAVVSGPRRVGKTFLVQHLVEQAAPTTAVYFEATEAGEADQLRRFAQALSEALGADALLPTQFADWEQALVYCANVARSQPLVVVLDEVTYLMGSTQGFASIVQTVWDRLAAPTVSLSFALVLTGSAVGMVEDALSHKAALYQRPTLHLRLRPFTAAQAHAFAGRPNPVTFLEAYAACGGYPAHLDAWDFAAPTEDNLLRLAGTTGGMLLEDATPLLVSLPPPQRRALMAVGQGRSRASEIQNELGGTRPERALESLERSQLVVAAKPLGAPLKARPEHRVNDVYLRFWIRVLSGYVQRIEAGQGAAALAHSEGQWQGQLGAVFEEAARDHAARLSETGELPRGSLVGEWWSTSGQPCQVDVLALREHRSVAVGEARWQRQPLGQKDVDQLARALRRVPDPVPDALLLLWGRGGIRSEVRVGRVRGFGPTDMLT